MKNSVDVEEERLSISQKEEVYKVMSEEPYAQHLGIELLEIEDGSARASLPVQDFMLNSHGTAHGAVIYALADYVFACACNSYGKTSVGLSTNINFMTAGKAGSTLTASAKEINKNHKISWYNIKVENEENTIASMEATAYRKNQFFITT